MAVFCITIWLCLGHVVADFRKLASQVDFDPKIAVDECLKLSPSGDCKSGPHGQMSEWSTSSFTNLKELFQYRRLFDGDLSEWDVSQVTAMQRTFAQATSFDGDISKWDVSKVTRMDSTFFDAYVFNSDISKWDVSKVTDMSRMFYDAKSFNGDISKWDVSKVKDMYGMFCYSSMFNGDISKWNVLRVKSMLQMFYGASSFNGNLVEWQVTHVRNMRSMFASAISFNGDISRWDVSNVEDMTMMFKDASVFDRVLCGEPWRYGNAVKKDMFAGSPGSISTTNCVVERTEAPKTGFSRYWEASKKLALRLCAPSTLMVVCMLTAMIGIIHRFKKKKNTEQRHTKVARMKRSEDRTSRRSKVTGYSDFSIDSESSELSDI